MKFNKEEINFCLRIAEWHRKLIEEGDWVVLFQDYADGTVDPWVFSVNYVEEDYKTDKPLCIKQWDGDHKMMSIGFDEVTPLWDLFDCLKFFKEKGYRTKLDEDSTDHNPFNVKIYGHKSKRAVRRYGKTLLEACLQLVGILVEEETK